MMTLDRATSDQDDDPLVVIPSLCAPFAVNTDIAGVSVSVFDSGGRQSTVCASDSVALRIDECQLELGYGPHQDVIRTTQPVLIPDVRTAVLEPAFGAQLQTLGVRALFVFPLKIGAAVVGVVSLYRLTSGGLSTEDVRTILGLMAVTASTAVRQALALAQTESVNLPRIAGPEMRREVHQATGMIMIQLDVDATEAFAHLRARAFASDRPVHAVARDVVAGLLDFGRLD